jgi:RNA polymerase sigma factor (TIGR02999 family)
MIQPPPDPAITDLLQAWSAGDRGAFDVLVPLIYQDLHQMAAGQLRREHAGSLTPTGLVNEAWLRLSARERIHVDHRGEFFAVAAQAMRRVLTDRARRRLAGKRRAHRDPISLDDLPAEHSEPEAELLIAVDEALIALAAIEPRLTRVVECRFYAGLSESETAAALGVTERTVRRDWLKARGFLATRLHD